MSDLNRCEFIGRLGNDPEIAYTGDGKAVAKLSLATTEKWKDKQGQTQEKTTWVRIVAFGRLAEIMAEYLRKGSQAYIAGKLTVNKWQDKAGNDRYTTEILANELRMLGGGQGGTGEQSKPAQENNRQQAAPPAPDFTDFDSSIPF